MLLLRKWFKLPQWQKIIIGLILGILTGLIFKSKAQLLLPIGTIFIHAIQMLVAPVVMTAIVCAVISLTDFNKMGRIITKSLFLYGFTMLISASIGILIAQALNIGHDFPIANELAASAPPGKLTLGDILVSFIPTSPVAAFANNNVMQILCFAFIFGVSLRLAGEQGKAVRELFLSLSDVVFLFAKIVVGFAPYGVFALIACVTGQYGMAILIPLMKLVGTVYLSCGILIVVIFSIMLSINRINPLTFFKKVSEPLITSFTTSSSAALYPLPCDVRVKISKLIAVFLISCSR
jgi:DAACS family dicarboxylate/amino acid:cation (Na+ or H+) symporter